MVIYLTIISIAADYDVTMDTTSRMLSSANKFDNFDPWWANLPTKYHLQP